MKCSGYERIKKGCLDHRQPYWLEIGWYPDNELWGKLSGRRTVGGGFRCFWHGETETDFSTFGGSTCLPFGALFWSFMSAKPTDFLEDAFHFELRLEALQGAVDWLTFADLDFWHSLKRKEGRGI
jgi:hypothetical protein